MWFKNLRIYTLTGDLPCAAEELDGLLAAIPFVPCSGLDSRRIGWVPPLGATATAYTHAAGHFHLVCARMQQKVLPGSAVRDVLDEKILALEAKEGRKLRKRERAELKDEVIQTLLPRALTRSQLCWAFMALDSKLLLVDSPTPARAEDVLNLLRDSLGSLPVKPLVPTHAPADIMTRWLGGNRLPKSLRLGQQCDLRDPLHSSNTVRCRQQELDTSEIRNHLEAGKQASALGLNWNDRLQFVLTEDLGVRSLKFTEILQREGGVDDDQDAAVRFDNDFALMSMELDHLCADLIEIFGRAD